MDKDGSGVIDFEDFLALMTSKMGERDSQEEILKAFKLFDDDNTGKITFKNLKRCASLKIKYPYKPLKYTQSFFSFNLFQNPKTSTT